MAQDGEVAFRLQPCEASSHSFGRRHLHKVAAPVIEAKFSRKDCGNCAKKSLCTTHERRNLTFRPREQHEALMANRQRQATPAFKAEHAHRAGIEGTLSFGIRACQMRRSRYRGLAKTHLQHCASAAVMNLARMARWLAREPRARTRQTPFQKLQRTAP